MLPYPDYALPLVLFLTMQPRKSNSMKSKTIIIALTLVAIAFSGIQKSLAQNSDKKNNTLILNTDNFDETIKNGVVLVDFWATWCGPCRTQGPIIDQIADSLVGKVVVGKVDIDKNRALSTRYAIQYIPTTIIFVDGVAVDKASGLQTKDVLMKRLSAHIK